MLDEYLTPIGLPHTLSRLVTKKLIRTKL